MRVALVAAALACGGCSFLFSEGPPRHHDRLPWFQCSTSAVPPIVDVASVALSSLALMAAISDDADGADERERRQSLDERRRGIAFSTSMLVIQGPSAVYGFMARARCEEALRQLAVRQAPYPIPVVPVPVPVTVLPPPGNAVETSPDAGADVGAGAADANGDGAIDTSTLDAI